MRAGGWQKARMEQQMHEWFGAVPKFIITLAADYCSQCSDAEFCAWSSMSFTISRRRQTISAHQNSTRKASRC